MPRPREFEIDDAVDRAMDVFWAKGYDGASLSDLLDAMAISRGSLYKAFRSKKALFLRALDRYDQQIVAPVIDALTAADAGDGATRIRAVFEGVVRSARGGDRRGCLLCNSAAGAANTDAEIAKAVAAMVERITMAFAAALASSGVEPDDSGADIDLPARGLTAGYIGLRILARSGQPHGLIARAAEATLDAFAADAHPAMA